MASQTFNVGSAGVLTVASGGAISGTPALAASGTVNLNNPSLRLSTLNGPATGVVNLNGTNLIVNSGGAFAGTLENGGSPGSLTVTGGLLTLSGSDSYTGRRQSTAARWTSVLPARWPARRLTSAAAGVLTVESGGAISGTPALAASGTVNFNNPTRMLSTLNGPATGVVNLNGTNLIVGSGGVFAGTLENGGSPGSLTVTGGLLTLSGNNTYTGTTFINGGVLQADTAGINGADITNGIAFAGGTLKANDSGGIATNKAITASSTILLDTSNGPITLGGTIASTTAGLSLTGASLLTLSGTNYYTGTTSINGGVLQADTAGINGSDTTNPIAFGGGTLKANDSGGIATNKAITASSTILLDTSNGPITLGGTIASTTAGLTVTGANVLALSGSNNYAGGTTVSGGTLQVRNLAALGSGGLTANAGVVDLNSYGISIPALNGAAGVITDNSGSGSVTTLTVTDSGDFGGTLADGNGQQLALLMNGPGTLILSGSGDFNGGDG